MSTHTPKSNSKKSGLRVALLADAHANLPALEAVLKDAGKQRPDEVWYLGDFLGYGPYPQEVVEVLKKHSDATIAGNYDLNVLKFPQKQKNWKRKKDPSKYFSFNWTHKNMTAKGKKYLQCLPTTQLLKRGRRRYLLVHGSPEQIDEPLKKDTPQRRFAQIAGRSGADVILCGHTHNFFDKSVGGVRFINPGSIGRPFDADPRASYALLEARNGKLTVRQRRVRYDIAKTLRKMKRAKFPKDIIRSIREGRSLDAIREKEYNKTGKRKMLDEVLRLARACRYEQKHSHQVTKLALKLFDELKSLHHLKPRHRLLLQAAGLLHDIGWMKGRVRHHKTARDIIMKSFRLPLGKPERTLVALLARYHRRALPKSTHKYYADLDERQKEELKKLASILRVADGLDRAHQNSVRDLKCLIQPQKVIVQLQAPDFSEWEQLVTQKKADLFEATFKRHLLVHWRAGK